MHANPYRYTIAAGLVLGLLLGTAATGTATIAGLPDETAAKTAVKCQEAIGKAGEKFVKNKQKNLDKCFAAIFKCIQTKEAAKQPDCIAKAAEKKCDKSLAKIFDKDEPKLEESIVKKCDVPGKLGLADLLSADGLDFDSQVGFCSSEYGVNLNGVDDIAECIRRHKECTVERLVRLQFPRAAELLDSSGVNGALVGNLTCLMGDTTPGGGFGDSNPKEIGKPIDKCAKETKKGAIKFALAKIKSIEKCLKEVFKCVQTKPGDQACLDKAADKKCAKEFAPGTGKIAKAEAKLRSGVQKKCGPAGFTELSGAMGMHLDDVATACLQYGVTGIADLDDYIECLFRQHECLVDDMIAIQYPRLTELLTEVGFESEVPAVFCGPTPTPTATATPTPTVTPTATPTVTPTLTPVPTVTSTPNNCGNGSLDSGEDCDASAAPPNDMCANAGNGLQTCNACTCECPSIVTFDAEPNDPVSKVDAGWTGLGHAQVIINGGTVTVTLSGGDEGIAGRRDPTCGVMNIGGPIENPDAGSGQIDSQRCSVSSWMSCTADTDCPATETCLFYFGSRLTLSAGQVSACVDNYFVGNIVGTADVETGESANTVSLISRVVVGAGVDKPCANCLGDSTMNDGSLDGTCDAGHRAGQACDVMGRSPLPAFNGDSAAGDGNTYCLGSGDPVACCTSGPGQCTGPAAPDACCTGLDTGDGTGPCATSGTCLNGTSLDCPSTVGASVGNLPINLSNSTGNEDLTIGGPDPNNPSGPGCRAFGFGSFTCACDTCATAAAEPCNSDVDCPVSITCGGERCLGGSSAGATCTGNSDCPGGGTCSVPGLATASNACNDANCTPPDPNNPHFPDADGVCPAGPADPICFPTETYRGCGANSDCNFPGDTCQAPNRLCFLDNGVVGNTIAASGMADVPVNDVAVPVLASTFCIAPTTATAINQASGLPGPGRVTLTGTAMGLPNGP